MTDQSDTLLVVESADHRDDRLEIIREPEPVAQRFFIRILRVEIGRAVLVRNEPVDFRIPFTVVDSVEHTPEFISVVIQHPLQPVPKRAVANFIHVGRGHGGDKVGVHHAALHQVHRAVIAIVAEAVIGDVVRGIQMILAQHEIAGDTLVVNIVNGETHTRMGHAELAVGFVQQHRHQRALPVVHMNNIGMFAGLEHELERGLREKGEPLGIVLVAVHDAAAEKVFKEMRLDEIDLHAVDESEIDIAMNPEMVVRNPQIAVRFGVAPDAVHTHAIVARHDDFDVIAPDGKFAGQALHDIGKPPHLGYVGELRRDMNDIHKRSPNPGLDITLAQAVY